MNCYAQHDHYHEQFNRTVRVLHELFMVMKGQLSLELRGHDEEPTTVVVNPGEFFIVPRGVEHKPTATEETHLLLFEPLSTKHTGDVQADITVETYEEI